MQGSLSIRELCESAQVSRASYYRNWKKREPKQEEVALRDAIQRLAMKDRHCGYRRIVRLLKREGWMVNHKRVLRLMREDNLLSIRRRRFVITTESQHSWRVYPNLGETWCSVRSINCGCPILPTSDCNESSFIWPSFWTFTRGEWWVGASAGRLLVRLR